MSGATGVPGKGLTWRSIAALLFALFLVEPVIIYNFLVYGYGIPISVWLVVLLWLELALIAGAPLSRQEIFIIMAFEWMGVFGYSTMFLNLLKNLYFTSTEALLTAQVSLDIKIPDFFVPVGPEAQRVIALRTFFDRAWLKPILVQVVVPTVLTAAANLVLGLFTYYIYGVVEKLPFPWASAQATTINALAERDPRFIRVFTLAMVLGLIYNFMTRGLSSIAGAPTVTFFPRAYHDLTHAVELVLPGASFAFTSDLTFYLQGMLLPFDIALAQFLGSMAFYFVGTWIITINDLWPPEAKWGPGRGFMWIFDYSQRYFWTSFGIGLGIVTAILPLLLHPRTFGRALKSVSLSYGGTTGRIMLAIFFACGIGASLFTKYLVPGFPLWILLFFSLVWSLIGTMLQTYSAGLTFGMNIPYMKELAIYYSGYKQRDIWFAPVLIFTGGSNVASHLKLAELTNTRVRDYVIAYILVFSLGMFSSLLFTQLLWQAAPIPSWAYPYTITGWQTESVSFWSFQRWLWTGYLFRKQWILAGLASGTIIYLLSDLVLKQRHLLIGIMTGWSLMIPIALAYLIGAAISKVLGKRIPQWSRIVPLVVLGFTIGDSLLGLIFSLRDLISRALWLKPY